MDTTYSFTREQLRRVIRESIRLYKDYRKQYDCHDCDDGKAIYHSASEMVDRLDAEFDQVENGTLEPKHARQIL